MPNGKPLDHPYTDIIVYGRDVYSPRAADLVREITRLGDEETRRELSDLLWDDFDEFQNPDVEKLERILTEWRDRLRSEARNSGHEADED